MTLIARTILAFGRPLRMIDRKAAGVERLLGSNRFVRPASGATPGLATTTIGIWRN